jgi:putative sterol carrier protein
MSSQAAGSDPASLEEALDWLRKHFDPDAAGDLHVVYQYELSGLSGGALYARVDDGRLEVAAGSFEAADVRFRLAAADFFAILAGRANADMLFMEDRIEIEGDLFLALKMRRLFRSRG